MGKSKQKVRWSTVDGLHWSSNQADTSPEGSAGVVKGEAGTESGSGGTRRSSTQGWTSSLAPRFERKAAAEAEQKHIYYEGEFCEAEELPNGFTKIRSKNLDVLFKRDYYEQRLAAQQQISEELKKLKNSESTEGGSSESLDEDQKENVDMETDEIEDTKMGSIEASDATAKSSLRSFDQIDLNDIPEFKPMDADLETSPCDIDSGHTSPFYINHQPHELTPGPQYDAPPRPNLYLYSPSNNTLIPCEEIIIPNPVMSPDGPVYSGPTNIYLAYPVQGPDGRGYITQPFAPPGSVGSYMSQDSSSYSPSMSYDGSNCYSSTPHTPNSGQDSGSSTQPTSPPPLANYHPTNWINQPKDMYYSHPLPPHTEGYYDPQPVDKSTNKPNHLNPPQPVPTNSAAAPVSTAPSATVTYIPGLPLNSMGNTPKRSQKRRKKKTKTESMIEHRGSTSSESETQKFSASGECNMFQAKNDEMIPEQTLDEFVAKVPVETFHEIHLTDDLADSLVNPPTDPEGSEDEVSHQISAILPNDPQFVKDEEKVNETNFSNKTNSAVETLNNNEAKNEMEMDDKEVFEIIETIKDNVSIKDEFEAINAIVNVDTVNAIDNLEKDTIEKEDNIEVQSESFLDPIETKFEQKVQDCKIDINKVALIEQENVPGLEKTLKNKKRKTKKCQKLVLKSEIDTKLEISTIEDQICIQNSNVPAEIKKSYSSVIKANLAKESNKTHTISSQPKVETVPISSPLPTNTNSPPVQSRSEQESDNWEKVPLSVSKPENWEKTSKKRKHKNKITKFKDSPLPEEIPNLEVVAHIEESLPPKEMTKVLQIEAIPEEENTNDDEIEQEKKKCRRRKKKFGSEDPEESTGGHRVVICDEQIDTRYSRAVRRASEVLSPSLLDTVKTSGYCDFLVISELGSGISRGCMNFGRLYQGKYVPPERIDGLLPECEEEESMEEEAGVEEVIGDKSCITASEDIDLD